MKTRQHQSAPLWQPKSTPAPEPKKAEPTQLSPEQEQLVEELAPFGVEYHPEVPCVKCGCPLDYPLTLSPDIRLCCACYPGGRVYGYERQDRIIELFPRRAWRT